MFHEVFRFELRYILRIFRTFTTEKGIFRYHIASFFFFLFALSVFLTSQPHVWGMAAWLALASAHGIYSLSFLELWSLAYGGYSLRILDLVRRSSEEGVPLGLNSMRRMGDTKKKGRTQTLISLRLAACREDKFLLTGFGRIFVRLLRLVSWPSKMGSIN